MSLLHAPTYRWTVEDYEELGRTRIFHEDDRVELLHGEIVIMSPIGYRHATALTLLNIFFGDHRRGRYAVTLQNPFTLDRLSQPQPDLTLLEPSCLRAKRLPLPSEVFLVIEVSDSSVRYDREDKGPAYAAEGIREYWLLNLEENQLEVFRAPGPDGYQEQLVFSAEQTIAPLVFPDLVLRVGDFLP